LRVQRISHSTIDYFFKKYKSPSSKIDMSLLFIEKTFLLMNSSGISAYICTSQWMTADYGKNIRSILSDGKLHEIVNFGSLPVFKNASTYPAILTLSNMKCSQLISKKVVSKEQLNNTGILNLDQTSFSLKKLSEKPWTIYSINLLKTGIPISPLKIFGKAYVGTKSGLNEAFVLSVNDARKLKIEKEILLPYAYRGGEVSSYAQLNPDSVIIYPYFEAKDGMSTLIQEKELKRIFPNAYSFLFSHKSLLKKRMDSRKLYADGDQWYKHVRPGSFSLINKNKLVVKGISLRCNVGILKKGAAFDGARCPCIVIENSELCEEYFLGILNSKFSTYYLKSVCPPKMNNYIEFSVSALTNFPLRLLDLKVVLQKQAHDKIVSHVNKLLELNKSEEPDSAQIMHYENQVDKLVYELYGLNADEIKIIEEATSGKS